MGHSPWRYKESDMTEANEHAHTRPRDAQVRPVLLAAEVARGQVVTALLRVHAGTDKMGPSNCTGQSKGATLPRPTVCLILVH